MRVERVVRHHHVAHAREREHALEVLGRFLRAEEVASLSQVLRRSVQTEGFEHRDDAARGLRQRSALDEERAPDEVGLLRLRHAPEVFVLYVRGAERLGDEVVVGQKLVHAREVQRAELGREQVRVHVEDARGVNRLLDVSAQRARVRQARVHTPRAFGVAARQLFAGCFHFRSRAALPRESM